VLGQAAQPITDAVQKAITAGALTGLSGGDALAGAQQTLLNSAAQAAGSEVGLPPKVSQGVLDLIQSEGQINPITAFKTAAGALEALTPKDKDLRAEIDQLTGETLAAGEPAGEGTLVAGPMDFSAPNRAEQKTQVADYIRNQAANGVAGFKVGPGGVLEVEDRDRGITHRFTSDGSVLGSVDTVFGSRTGEFPSTSAGVKDFLSTPYVQGLFQGGEGSGDSGRYMVSEVADEGPATGSLTQEQSDELLEQAEQDLMEEELYQVNSPVTLPPTDVDTAADSGQSVFDQIDQYLGQLALDRQEETRAEQDQEQAQEAVQPPVQPSTGVGPDEVRQIVSDALQANPSLTEQQVQQIVNGAIQNMPAGLTTQDVAQVVDDAISRLPQGPTTADIDLAVNRAMTDVATKSDVADAIRNIQFPEGINQDDVSRAISDYMRQNPGLSAQDVASQVSGQLSKLPSYATPADVNAAINGAMANVATRSDVEAAIRNIQFPAGISQGDVTRAISQYMQQNPGLSAQDVASEVAGQLSRLPAYATPDDVNSAIQGAMRGVATSEDVRRAIEGIQFPAGITEADVTRAVSDYMRQNPGLSAQDVSTQVAAQLKTLPAYATPADVDNAIRGAMEGVATTADVRRAIEGIQFPEGITQEDVTQAISTYMQQNPGLSAQDVAAQVADQLKTLPAYATPADVESAIQGAMTNVATRADVEKAIQGIQFPTGISRADVTDAITQYMRDNPGLSADEVTSLVGQQLSRLPAYATPDDVNASIRGAMADVATRSDVQEAIAGIQFPAGISRADVTDVITDYMRQNPGLSAAEVTSLVGEQLNRLPAFATPQDVESTVRDALAGYATSEDVAQIGRGVEAVRADLTRLIADAQASGLKGDAALNASLEALAGELGMTRQGLLGSLGTTESVLRSEFSSQIGNVQTQMTELGEGLRSAIADAQLAGLRGDDALQLGLESLADRLGTTREELLATLGTNEQSLRSEFASQLGGVSSQISNVQTLLLDKINAAYSVGLQGDEALRAGLDSLAADLGTTQANLLSQLGTTEAALRSQFGSQIGEVRTQVGQLGQDLQDAIDSARRSGLQGDAALQAGLDTLAGSLGTTRSELLSQLGTTEQALRSDFASQLGGVQSQVTQLGSDLSSAIEAARAAGLQGDAALQAGLTSLAGDLGTTKDELLSQLGTTEQGLRADFASQLGGVQTQVTELGADLSSAIESARAAGLQGDAALQAGLDTLANRLGTTTDQLLSQLGTTEQGLRDQFGAQIGEVQTQVGQLGQDLQASIDSARRAGLQGDAALQAGLDTLANRLGTTTDQLLSQLGATEQGLRDQFAGQLGEVESSLGERLTGVESGLTQQIGGVEERLNSRIEDLVDQGVDFQTATNQALKEVTGSIGTLAEQQQQESERTQTAIGSVETRLGDRINDLMQQGLDWQEATNLAIAEVSGSVSSLAEETQSSIGALGLDVESQIEEFRRAQEAADAAAAETARQQAAEQRSATEAAVARAVQQSAEEAAAREAARQEEARRQAQAQRDESQRQQMLSLGTSLQSKGSSTAMDPYKATFLAPFIVGGEAPKEFTSPLAGFLKGAMTQGFMPETPQRARAETPEEPMEFFDGSTMIAQNPLEMYNPEQEYQGLFGFRSGGLVPLMAQGGTRYGHNAHGALRVLEHSGKHRVDYRQGDAVTGIGDGQSDDIPAMLADGEFVIPADVVSALGNGSTKAGSDKLYDMMHSIRRHHRSAGPKDLPPPAKKSPLDYITKRRSSR
jgi:phage tail tube protein FII